MATSTGSRVDWEALGRFAEKHPGVEAEVRELGATATRTRPRRRMTEWGDRIFRVAFVAFMLALAGLMFWLFVLAGQDRVTPDECREQGGTVEVRETESGSETVCVLP